MAKVNQINRATCRVINEAALAALQSVAQQFGLSVSAKSGSFTSTSFTGKFAFSLVDASGNVQSQEAENFRISAGIYGLQADDLGKQFVYRGQVFTVTGLKYSTKYPILASRSDGKGFKFGADLVKSLIRRAS